MLLSKPSIKLDVRTFAIPGIDSAGLVPVQLAKFNAIPKSVMANASALLNTVKQIGTSMGITINNQCHATPEQFYLYTALAEQVNALTGSMDLVKMLKGPLFYSQHPRRRLKRGFIFNYGRTWGI